MKNKSHKWHDLGANEAVYICSDNDRVITIKWDAKQPKNQERPGWVIIYSGEQHAGVMLPLQRIIHRCGFPKDKEDIKRIALQLALPQE